MNATSFESDWERALLCCQTYKYIRTTYILYMNDDDVIFDISFYFLHMTDWMNSRPLSFSVSAHTCSSCVSVAAHSLYIHSSYMCVWHSCFIQHIVCLTLSMWIWSHTVLVRFVTKTEVNVVYSVFIFLISFYYYYYFFIRYTYPFQQST